jgi:hypothetical protein
MLPAFARLKQEEGADFMAGLLKGFEPNDPVQLYVVKGLKEYYTLVEITPDDPPEKWQNDARRIQLLLDYLERLAKRPPSSKQEETDAVPYLRREGMRALAAIRVPGIIVKNKKEAGKLQAPIAYRLMLTLVPEVPRDGAKGDPNAKTIPPTLSEQCEAAIALCKMQPRFIPGYRNDVAAYLVGRFLVRFAEEYSRDRLVFGGKKDKDSKLPRKTPKLPWHLQAGALSAALKDMEKNQGDNAKIKELIERGRNVLAAVETARNVETAKMVENTALEPLSRAVKALTPAAPGSEIAIYQDTKEFMIRVPN